MDQKLTEHFIRLQTDQKLTAEQIGRFAFSVMEQSKMLMESPEYLDVDIYEHAGTAIEIPLKESLSDSQIENIMNSMDIEEFVIESNMTMDNFIVIYPGRFHIFHHGHNEVLKYIHEKYPNADVYIATSDKVEQPDSPFSFDEKKQMMVGAGVSADKIIQTTNPYVPNEILQKYNKENTVALTVVSAKDNDRFDFPKSGIDHKKEW